MNKKIILADEIIKYNLAIITNRDRVDFVQNVSSSKGFYRTCREMKASYQRELSRLKAWRDELITDFSPAQMAQLTSVHGQLVNRTVHVLIDELNIDNLPFGVFWNGSFARNNNRLSSDYDLNFVYSEVLRPQIQPIEEKICAAFAWVDNKPRNYIHGAVSCHLPLLRDPGTLEGLERLEFRVRYANREPHVLEEYLLNHIAIDQCYDWTSTYKIVHGPDVLNGIFEKAMKKERDLTKTPEFHPRLYELINDQVTKMQTLLEESKKTDLLRVSDIKGIFKKRALAQIYVTLALIRRKLLTKSSDIGPIRIDQYGNDPHIKKVLGYGLSRELFDTISYYTWEVIKLETTFEIAGIRFGNHSKQSVDKSFFQIFTRINNNPHRDLKKHYTTLLEYLCSTLTKGLLQIRNG